VAAIASFWDTATELTFTREFRMTLAALAGLRAGMICVAGPNRITGDDGDTSFAVCIEVALAAMLTLAEADRRTPARLDRHDRCL
jgi:hypothetical protein